MSLADHAYLNRLRTMLRGTLMWAVTEDLNDGDITARVLALNSRRATANLICREQIAMCGSAWFRDILDFFKAAVPRFDVEMTCRFEDGSVVPAGETLFRLSGNAASIVALERTLLNYLGRGIGIANATRRYVDAVRAVNPHTQILDTRKTLPAYRYFDKYAVLCGGGQNHRMNLGDQVLIKENHLAGYENVTVALASVRANLERLGSDATIQIEVETPDQLRQAIDARCPLIMVDNFTPQLVAEVCQWERGDCLIEVSGGITLDNIAQYAAGRPDRISIGAITHSIKAPDLSLLITEE